MMTFIRLRLTRWLMALDRRWSVALALGFLPSVRDSIQFRRVVLRKDGKRGAYLYSIDGSVDLVLGRTHTKPSDEIPF
jgi:hypothetical protein